MYLANSISRNSRSVCSQLPVGYIPMRINLPPSASKYVTESLQSMNTLTLSVKGSDPGSIPRHCPCLDFINSRESRFVSNSRNFRKSLILGCQENMSKKKKQKASTHYFFSFKSKLKKPKTNQNLRIWRLIRAVERDFKGQSD